MKNTLKRLGLHHSKNIKKIKKYKETNKSFMQLQCVCAAYFVRVETQWLNFAKRSILKTKNNTLKFNDGMALRLLTAIVLYIRKISDVS